MTDPTARIWDNHRNRHHRIAGAALKALERQLREISDGLGKGGSVTHALGAARRSASDLAELTEHLAKLAAMDEWSFAVEADRE